MRLLQGGRWHGFTDPTHIQLFGRTSLRLLLEATGYQVHLMTTPFHPLPLPLSNLVGRTGLGGRYARLPLNSRPAGELPLRYVELFGTPREGAWMLVPDHLTCQASCLLYTSDAADDLLCVDLGGRRIIKK